MTPQEVKRLVDMARATNRKRDRIDRKAGFGAPGDGGHDDLIRTAMCAIEAGMREESWEPVAEGYEMLADLHHRLTGKMYNPAASAT